jgi:predicted Na+-dependent transporter
VETEPGVASSRDWIVRFVVQNRIIIAILIGVAASFVWPAQGQAMRAAGASGPLIFLIFLCQGAGVDASELRKGRELARVLLWGVVVSQVLGPLAGLGAVEMLGWEGSDRAGLVLMCCMAPTLVSGAVLAGRAGGDQASALLLAVGINLLAIVTMPLWLAALLGADVAVDRLALIRKLALFVLLPSLVGHAIRRQRPRFIKANTWIPRHVPVVIFAVLLFASLAEHTDTIRGMGGLRLLSWVVPSGVTHLLLLAAAYWGGRAIVRLGERPLRSVAIVTSQKTIPVAVAVWSLALVDTYPEAILVAVLFHFTQIMTDGVIAARWARKTAEPAADDT